MKPTNNKPEDKAEVAAFKNLPFLKAPTPTVLAATNVAAASNNTGGTLNVPATATPSVPAIKPEPNAPLTQSERVELEILRKCSKETEAKLAAVMDKLRGINHDIAQLIMGVKK